MKRILVILTLIVVVSVLGACVRSASTPPVGVITPPVSLEAGETPAEGSTESGDKGEGAPAEGATAPAGEDATAGEAAIAGEAAAGAVPTNDVMAQLQLFVTQTAAAAQIAGGQAPEATAAPAEGAPAGPGETQPTQAEAQPVPVQPTQAGAQPVPVQPTQAGAQPVPVQPTQAGAQPVPPPPAATQPGQIVVPTATPGIPSTYTVQTSEFVYCIARRFDVNPYEMMSINGLSQNSVLKAGMVLKMPKTGHPFPGQRSLKDHPTQYVVGSGENIYAISCKFGDVSPDMIAYANNLQAPFTLTAGQQIYIP